ncbi:MAG: hypothetical protein WDN48_09085 [Pseudolabrys sp.]
MKAKTFIAGFFGVVAVVAAASIYFSATTDKAKKSVAALASPDGRFKAVKITLSEDGAKPFCFDSVSVMLAAYPDEFAQREKAYEVYAAPCASFAGGAASPKIEWQSATALQIVYAAAPGAKPPRTKDIDVTKAVHVTVVARD